MAKRKYTRRKKVVRPKKAVKKVVKKAVKPKKLPFVYGKITPKNKIIHQYAPNVILQKFYFNKFDVMIEAVNLKEAKTKIRKLYR